MGSFTPLTYTSFCSDKGHYLCCDLNKGHEILADRTQASTWERFHVVPLKDGYVAIQSIFGRFLCAINGGNGRLMANRNKIDIWEKFKCIWKDDNHLSLQAHNGMYVSAFNGGGSHINVKAKEIGPFEVFTITYSKVEKIGLQGFSSRLFLSARGKQVNGDARQMLDRETFQIEWISDSEIALKTPTGYLCAIDGGGSTLEANRSEISHWEKFRFERTPDNHIALKTGAQGLFICATPDGKKVTADRPSIGPWEKFLCVIDKGSEATKTVFGYGRLKHAENKSSHTFLVRPWDDTFWDVLPQPDPVPPYALLPGLSYDGYFGLAKVADKVMKLSKNFEELVAQNDLVEIINDAVPFQEIGRTLKADFSTGEIKLSNASDDDTESLFGGFMKNFSNLDWEVEAEVGVNIGVGYAKLAVKMKNRPETNPSPADPSGNLGNEPDVTFHGSFGDIDVYSNGSGPMRMG